MALKEYADIKSQYDNYKLGHLYKMRNAFGKYQIVLLLNKNVLVDIFHPKDGIQICWWTALRQINDRNI